MEINCLFRLRHRHSLTGTGTGTGSGTGSGTGNNSFLDFLQSQARQRHGSFGLKGQARSGTTAANESKITEYKT